jgi:serine phosphatase RsbU (regulator of sigma subunit)
LQAGRLRRAVNVVECTRLQRAAAAEGDTEGLRFHASVPILLRDQPLGVLNVATEDWQFLSASDLQLLSAAGLQIAAALERARLYETAQAHSDRMERELEMARVVQASLLPQKLPDTLGFGIAADWRAAREMAGDFYDVCALAGGRTGIVVADVLDKGAPAALYMVLVRSLIRAQAERSSSPAEILTEVNRQLVAQSSADMFVTVFLGILDPSTCALTYASAGHPPPLLRRAAAQGDPEPLARGGPLLGVFDEVELVDATTYFSPGDLLVVYTDGATEARNPDGELFGERRLKELVRSHGHSSAQDLLETLMSSVAAFGAEAPQSDDITVVVVRCQPD